MLSNIMSASSDKRVTANCQFVSFDYTFDSPITDNIGVEPKLSILNLV